MIKWKITEKFCFYIENDRGDRIELKGWNDYKKEYLAEISILSELIDNGFAESYNDEIKCEIKDVLILSEIDKQILGLPICYPYDIYIQSGGQLNQNTFTFKYGFYEFIPNGNKLAAIRKGPLIIINSREYLLTHNQYLVCEALDSFNSLNKSERTYTKNLKCFGDIKSLSTKAASILDSYLLNQNVVKPDKINIDINYTNGILEIIPNIDLEHSDDFVKTFDQLNSIRSVYPVKGGTGTNRIVFEEEQIEELQKIKTNRRIDDPKKITEIVEKPEKYFNADIVDLKVFYSERVKEIGLYKPKFYPFVCPYKSEWIPGIIVKEPGAGTTKIIFKDETTLNEFINLKVEAKRNGEKCVKWKDQEIPIEDAEKFIGIAKQQFANPKAPIKPKVKDEKDQVLIIKENAEILEYAEEKLVKEKIEHSFGEITNLTSEITLKEHQVEGIAWLQSLCRENFSGCLLADDMGLGKTLQMLYFIEWHAQNINTTKPYIIVAPVTLLENWENEYKRFFTIQTLVLNNLHGNIGLTKVFNEELNKKEASQLQTFQLILTNYETLREYQATLCLVEFSVIVLDEAQKIKTPGTFVTNVSKALKGDFKIAMTGTPVENTLVDLWCIMDFSVPGLLGNAKEFVAKYLNPLKKVGVSVQEIGENLRKQIGVFVKRRLKVDVAKDLPSKIEHKYSDYQRVMPDTQLERYKIEMNLAKSGNIESVEKRNQILKSLWAIRDISDHPYLVDKQISAYEADELIGTSAKLQVICEILDKVKSKDEKVIIFADRKETQKMLQKVVYSKFDIFPSIVNGETPTTKSSEGKVKLSRQQTIDRFQSEDGFNIIIMSPLAAGIGLNVTSANHVIHYSRHWNPAKEQQATDRAYRIGQMNDVHVYYPMAIFPSEMINEDGSKMKSFDEVLDGLLKLKSELASSTLYPTDQAEVRPEDIYENVFGSSISQKSEKLSINDVDKLNPNLFEACIAEIYRTMGYKVYLTPLTHDKGADVVVLGENENLLIQAKHTFNSIGIDATQEIYTAKKYYESKFGCNFKLQACTNRTFTQAGTEIARMNEVNLVERESLELLLEENIITMYGINKIEMQRMAKI